MKMFNKLFNLDKLKSKNESIDALLVLNKDLEKQIFELKGYKLKYRAAQMLVDDDEALLEVIGYAECNESKKNSVREAQRHAAGRAGTAGGICGQSLGLGGLVALVR